MNPKHDTTGTMNSSSKRNAVALHYFLLMKSDFCDRKHSVYNPLNFKTDKPENKKLRDEGYLRIKILN